MKNFETRCKEILAILRETATRLDELAERHKNAEAASKKAA